MIILNILLGLVGLGIVILVHELGHFVAAKITGIEVQAFSIGWGKVLYRRVFRGTEYRLSLLPIGGYCKMKGEEFFRQEDTPEGEAPKQEEGSLFSVSPLKRALTYFAGPLANLIFSIVVLSIIFGAGFTVDTFGNRIILQSETAISSRDDLPADVAGLETGDVIVEIDGHKVESFRDIERYVTPAAGESLDMVARRGDRLVELLIVPELDTETGAGRIGIAAWVEPEIAFVQPDSEAADAGIQPGDRIRGVDGVSVNHSLDLFEVLDQRPESIQLELERDGTPFTASVPIGYTDEGNVDLGFSFAYITIVEREKNPILAIWRGVQETVATLRLSLKSIGLMFKGVNIRSAVSGPIRITYLVGEVASQSFSQGLGRGFLVVFRFLSMLSVALCFMNLLPIPALDGGFILISFSEIILRKPIRPKFFYRYQIIGFAIIFGILILTLFNDVFYLAGR